LRSATGRAPKYCRKIEEGVISMTVEQTINYYQRKVDALHTRVECEIERNDNSDKTLKQKITDMFEKHEELMEQFTETCQELRKMSSAEHYDSKSTNSRYPRFTQRRLMNQPKTHVRVLESLLEEIKRQN